MEEFNREEALRKKAEIAHRLHSDNAEKANNNDLIMEAKNEPIKKTM